MPLSMSPSGIEHLIKQINGNDNVKHFLANLGFVVGGSVKVITELGGNMIVCVKDSRIAINKAMANKVIV